MEARIQIPENLFPRWFTSSMIPSTKWTIEEMNSRGQKSSRKQIVAICDLRGKKLSRFLTIEEKNCRDLWSSLTGFEILDEKKFWVGVFWAYMIDLSDKKFRRRNHRGNEPSWFVIIEELNYVTVEELNHRGWNHRGSESRGSELSGIWIWAIKRLVYLAKSSPDQENWIASFSWFNCA